ncbi:MAG: hypothetical protein LBI43_05515 [Streptococcaceae bacterium]|nr:hypothetical protein [Streptococcaceae bacterium]
MGEKQGVAMRLASYACLASMDSAAQSAKIEGTKEDLEKVSEEIEDFEKNAIETVA